MNPLEFENLAAWFDALDTSSMLSSTGAAITDGAAVALWGDKSGNSGTLAFVSDGAASNTATTATKSITGNQTMTFDIAMKDWTPGTNHTLFSKLSGNSGLEVLIITTGVIRVRVGDGAAVTNFDSTTANTCTDLTRHTLVITYTDNSSVTFSIDGVALGTSVVVNKVLANGATTATIGTSFAGRIYRAQIGTVYDFNPSATTKLSTSITDGGTGGGTWTINTSGATGARISGARDLYQGTVANRPIWLQYAGAKYGYCNGVAGNGITTPDSATISITGDLEIIIDVLPDSWSTGSSAAYIAKYVFSTANRSWRLVSATGTRSIQLSWSADGTATVTAAFADHGITSGRQALKVTLDVDNGAGGWTAKLWKAATYLDSWTLVDTQTGVGTTSIYDGTAPLEVGSQNNLATLGVSGKYYYASVASGIGGAPAAIFTPSLYTSGATFTASTGEVWTINGGAHIVTRTGVYFDGSNDFFTCAVPLVTANAWSMYPVFCGLANVADKYVLTQHPGLAVAGRVVFLGTSPTSSGAKGYITFNNGGTQDGATSANYFDRITRVTPTVAGGNNYALRRNREAAETLITGQALTPYTGPFAVGAFGNGNGNCNFFMSELQVYSAAHATATQDRMALYAGRKWGFAV